MRGGADDGVEWTSKTRALVADIKCIIRDLRRSSHEESVLLPQF